MKVYKYVFLFIALVTSNGMKSQIVALKSNLLSDALANISLGVEVGLNPRWTIDIGTDYNGWNVNNHRWRHILLQPEARYWFCSRLGGNFVGFHAIGGSYNFGNIKNNIKFLGSDFSGLTENRYQGWGIGAGVSYGYAWILAEHWNLEATIGLGFIFTRFDTYECIECGRLVEKGLTHTYVGPTKLGVNLEYIF